MATKVTKFTGTVDWSGSPDKIKSTLLDLKDYLNSFKEDEAAQIVEEFAGKLGNSSGLSQSEKVQREKLVKDYQTRNSLLKEISSKLGKISDDLIDEQGKKAESGKTSWTSKPMVVAKKATAGIGKIGKEATSFLSNPLEWIKSAIGGLGGSLMSFLTKPIKALVSALFGGLLTAALAPGKLGFRLIKAMVGPMISSGLKMALKAGGWAFNIIKDLAVRAAGSVGKAAASVGSKVATTLKSAGGKVVRGAKSVASKAGSLASKAWGSVTDFFSSATKAVSGKVKDFAKAASSQAKKITKSAVQAAKSVASQAGKLASGVSSKVKSQFAKISAKVTKVFTKLGSYFHKKGGSKALTLAAKLPQALKKATSKLIPGIGWALVAYEIYQAAKKSNSVVSFAVNLVDGLSGGLISAAGAIALEGFDGENLGDYVENMISGSGNTSIIDDEDTSILDEAVADADVLESKSTQLLKVLDGLSFTGSDSDLASVAAAVAGNPNSTTIINEYKRLVQMRKAGTISEEQAKAKFKTFTQQQLIAGEPATSISGVVMTAAGAPEVLKTSDINVDAYAASQAQQEVQAYAVAASATASAVQAASMVSGKIAAQAATQASLMIQNNFGAPPTQVQVQG